MSVSTEVLLANTSGANHLVQEYASQEAKSSYYFQLRIAKQLSCIGNENQLAKLLH